MVASEETRKKFNSVNFAPLFKKYQPKFNELSENMRAFFNKDPEKGSKFSQSSLSLCNTKSISFSDSQLTVGYDANEMTLASNLIKFYLDEGYEIKEIHWALEYQRGISFGEFYFFQIL